MSDGIEPLSDGMRQQLLEDLHRARTGLGLAAVFDGESRLTSPTCGDEVTVRVSVVDGAIAELTWTGHGCTVSQASASALVPLATGLTVEEFASMATRFFATVEPGGTVDPGLGDAEAFVGIGRFPLRARCASLAWRATLQSLELIAP